MSSLTPEEKEKRRLRRLARKARAEAAARWEVVETTKPATTDIDEKERRRQRRLARKAKAEAAANNTWATVTTSKRTKKNNVESLTKIWMVATDKNEFWFNMPLPEYLKNYVQEYIRRSWFVKLWYQWQFIYDNTVALLHNFLFQSIRNIFNLETVNAKPEKINKWIKDNFWLEISANSSFKEWVENFERREMKTNWFINVVNIDVWLWKTMISVISMLCFIKWLQYIYHVLNWRKFHWIFDDESFIKITEEKKRTVTWFNFNDIKVNIICKKILSTEFEYTIRRLWEDFNYWFLYNWIAPKWYDFDNNFKVWNMLSLISYLAQMIYYDDVWDVNNAEHQTEIISSVWIFFTDWTLWDYQNSSFKWWDENTDEWRLELSKSIWLFLIDEYWTDSFFFWNWKNSVKRNLLWKIIWIWLTASKVEQSDSFEQCNSKFISKKEVLEELIKKWMYKEDWFLYRNLTDENEDFETIQSWLKRTIQEYKLASQSWINNWRKVLSLIMESIESFLKTEDQSVEEFMNNINNLKIAYDEQDWWWYSQQEKERLQNLITSFERLKQEKINQFYQESIFDKINRFDLSYLFEKNTIIILDNQFTNDDLHKLKSILKEKEMNIVSIENSKSIEWTWNVIIWRISEMSKWLNLQNFDNLMFLYLNQLTFDDVHQTIWRIDRIWSVANKEIVLISFIKDREFVDNLIKKRKEISNKYKIENYLLQDGSEVTWLNDFNKELNEIKARFDNLFDKEWDYQWKNKEKLNKDKLKLLNDNKWMIKDMIKDMVDQIKCYEEANNLILWWNTESELNLVSQILWFAK